MLVIDASVCVAALVDAGTDGYWAESKLAGATLVAPQLILIEVTNVLRRLTSSGRLSDLDASIAQSDLMTMTIELFPFAPFADRVWSLRHNLSSYDACYVALAESLKIPIATLDGRLINAPGTSCEFVTTAEGETSP